MGKKRKHSLNESEQEIDSKTLGNHKRYKNDIEEESQLNDILISNGATDSRYKVYLIKKPINITLEHLEMMRWSCDESVLSKTKLKTEIGTFRAFVNPNTKKNSMVHIPSVTAMTLSDAKNICAGGSVSGMITILPHVVKSKDLGGSLYEEGEEVSTDSEKHPNLKKIKKEATLDLSSRKERNKAYGTTSDSDGNPRKLPNLV